jgi:hypothetical protein
LWRKLSLKNHFREIFGKPTAIWRSMSQPRNSFWKRNFTRLLVLSCLIIFGRAALAQQSVTLTWSPSTNATVAGYKIYYGTASGNYTNTVDVGNVTSATISGLANSTKYYFAATTYDSTGDESAFSNEASFTTATPVVVPPPVTPPPVTPPPPVVPNNATALTLLESSAQQSITLSSITAIESKYASLAPAPKASTKSPLVITVATSNAKVIPKPTIASGSFNNPGKMTFRPVTGALGSAQITMTVSSNGVSGKTKTVVVLVTYVFNITVVPNPLDYPRLTENLTNNVVLVGQTVSLKMSAAGKAPLKYQWMLNGVSIPAATAATLTLKNVKASQAGNYSVKVYNAIGTTNSAPSLLMIQSTTAAHLSSLPVTGGKFSFQIGGISGTKYIVQASTDMKTWVSVQTNTAPFNFTDANSGNFKQRFYRTKTF